MASRFWVGGGSSSNFNATSNTNWSASSGGSNNASVPGSSDDVTFDGAGASGNSNSTISANITVLSLTFTSGYTATVTENSGVVLTVAGNFTDNTAHGWTVNSVANGALTISATSTITSGGKTWPGNVSFSGTSTMTLSGDWTISGTLNINGTTTINSNTLTCGGLTVGTSSNGGTTTVVMTGGTWSGNTIFKNNLSFNGNITISGSIQYNTGILTYISGTITNTSSLTVGNAAGATFNTDGMSWNNITVATSCTLTLNSLLTITGTFTINNAIAITFAGTGGFSIATFNCFHTTVGATFTLQNSVNYYINGTFNSFQTRVGSTTLFTSNDGTLRANLILQDSCVCNVLANFTRINANGGRPIITFNTTVTDCLNIVSQSNVAYMPVTSFQRGSRRKYLTDKNKTVVYQ